jgi:hypothetical protein
MKPSVNIADVIAATDDVLIRATFDRFHTVAFYLRRRGISATWIQRWGNVFGKYAMKAYRTENNGALPEETWEDGRRVALYRDTRALDAAMFHYMRHTVAGPLLDAGYDRKAAAKRQLRDRLGRFARAYVVIWNGPSGVFSKGRLTQERATRLVQKLHTDHRISAVEVRDARGHRADFAMAA